jgi:hypothetical protein
VTLEFVKKMVTAEIAVFQNVKSFILAETFPSFRLLKIFSTIIKLEIHVNSVRYSFSVLVNKDAWVSDN